ncbi:hypothetical protein Tco_0121158 [Tanacetum coccineum]
MAEENHPVAVFVTPKFDMPHHRSKLTSTDVKSITKEYDISLDLHPRAPPEGRSIDRLSKNDIALALRLPSTFSAYSTNLANRDTGFPLKNDILDVRAPVENIVDLRPVHHGLLFTVGLATIWEFPSVYSIFKDTRGNVITMFEYIRFLFTANVAIKKGVAIPAKIRPIASRGWRWRMQRFSAKEKKKVQAAITAAKKKESKKRTGGEEGSSKPKPKRKKTQAAMKGHTELIQSSNRALHLFSFLKGHTASSGGTTSPTPIRTPSPDNNTLVMHSQSKEEDVGKNLCCFGPRSGPHNMLDNEDNVAHVFSYESANESIHIYIDVYARYEKEDTPRIEPFVNLSGQPLNDDNEQVFVDESKADGTSRPLSNLATHHDHIAVEFPCRHVEEGESFGDVAIYRLENLQDDYSTLLETHEGCSNTFRKLVTTCQDLEHNANLYTNMSNRFKELKDEHSGCDGKLEVAGKESTERVKEKQKVLVRLGQTKVEKFNCIRKLLSIVGKGLSLGRTDEEILAVLKDTSNFDAYSNKKLYPMYNKLFEDEYPFVMKIASGYRHSVTDLLKVHPDPAPAISSALVGPPVSSSKKKI